MHVSFGERADPKAIQKNRQTFNACAVVNKPFASLYFFSSFSFNCTFQVRSLLKSTTSSSVVRRSWFLHISKATTVSWAGDVVQLFVARRASSQFDNVSTSLSWVTELTPSLVTAPERSSTVGRRAKLGRATSRVQNNHSKNMYTSSNHVVTSLFTFENTAVYTITDIKQR